MNSNINKKVKHINLGHIDSQKAWNKQESIFKKIVDLKIENRKKKENKATENYILVCSHPHVYTLGKSGNEKNLLINDKSIKSQKLEYYKINRGGDITYHGPGQLVIYPILDLENFFTDIHKYLRFLEEAVIMTLDEFGISSGRIENLTGVWVNINTNKPKKICAMGVKSSRWVTMHGLALNVSTDLKYFNNIVPCGIDDKEVTSIEDKLNKKIKLENVENKMLKNLAQVFKFKLIKK